MSTQVLVGVVIAAICFILLGIAMGFGPSMLQGFEAMRNDVSSATETDNGTTAATTNKTITLTYQPWAGSTSSISSVSSNDTGDTPVAYAVSEYSLTVTGLSANTSRTLTTVYDYDTTTFYTGLDDTIEFGPTMILLGFIIAVGLGGFMGIAVAGIGAYKQMKGNQ